MSKAFNLVDHGLLFELLLEWNLPCSVARFLLQWYSSQQLQIRWNGILSSHFMYQMVYNRVESYPQSYLRFILMSFCSVCKILVWVVNGRGCLLDVSAMLMTLPYLLLLLVHSGKCFRSALIRCGRLLQAAKLSPSVLIQHVFLSAVLYPWCFLGFWFQTC